MARSSKKYDFKKVEKKWQKKWEKEKVFEVKKSKKKKFYNLEMYPYPSASGLHMGHALNYVIGDIMARFKRMKGKNVLYPMGYDSLGLPAENAAIKAGKHPKDYTEKSVKNYIGQQKKLGLSYDWSRLVCSHDPEYYKWDQYFFLKFLKEGLAYKDNAPVNYCNKCKTVLANEQVHDGKCWRCGGEIEIKQLEQWFLKTTEYADELLKKLEELDWPEKIKAMQRNWIGKSEGVEINFETNKKEKWPIFTTRPDTIFGATFMVISSQHPRLMELVTKKQEKKVKKFLRKSKSVSQKDEMEKEGVFTGSYAINPVNQEKLPIYSGNFVLAGYGSGMVMAVPAHDQRDFEFAKKYDIPIKIVIQPETGDIKQEKMSRAFTGEGRIINSGEFNKIPSSDGKEIIADWLEEKGYGKKTTEYKLKDWLISRQRYWGAPIPVVNCDKCGTVPVKEEDLPVKLPNDVKFGKGNPLETNEKWIKTKCPKCGGKARRETETMDTFFDSSWYFLRYCDNKNSKKPFDKKKVDYWMPVDQYIGGAEHACMHLIYARFFTKALRDMGYLDFDEPFQSLFNQGMLLGPNGIKMSKSKGNVVNPKKVSEKYGIDTARFFLISQASPDKDIQWSDKGIEGSLKFLNRVFNIKNFKKGKSSKKIQHKINKTIKQVEKDIENFDYNLATIEIRELFKWMEKEKVSKKDVEKFLKLLSPFCPHLAEELWQKVGNKPFISKAKWPKVDESKIDEEIEKQEKKKDKLLEDVKNIIDILKDKNELEDKKKINVYAIPKELGLYKKVEKKIENTFGLKTKVESVKKADKEVKVRPGKPGILIK